MHDKLLFYLRYLRIKKYALIYAFNNIYLAYFESEVVLPLKD